MTERIAITGMGVVTPIGIGVEAYAEGLRAGRSGVGPIRAFDASGFETRMAAEVDDGSFDPAAFVVPPKHVKLMSRAARFAVAAAALARRDAGLERDGVDPRRLGVSLGAGGMGPVDPEVVEAEAVAVLEAARQRASYTFDLPSFARSYRSRTNPLAALRGLPNGAAAHVAIQQDARGPNSTVATACTAGTQAVGDALRMIRCGEADVVLAGGADAMVNPVGVLGFSMLGTLSTHNETPERASRPFDAARDGFVIGEGAGVLVLEREAFARARGARVWAELAGYGRTCDAYRITDERPDSSGAADAMRVCLEDAGALPGDVDYVNAHGTGTRMNDVTETNAIKAAFGPCAGRLAVSSTKSMIGHLLAAAGAVEAVTGVLALSRGFLPPTLNQETPDPECDLDYVPNVARPARVRAVLSNSFGFGGQNACVLMREW